MPCRSSELECRLAGLPASCGSGNVREPLGGKQLRCSPCRAVTKLWGLRECVKGGWRSLIGFSISRQELELCIGKSREQVCVQAAWWL